MRNVIYVAIIAISLLIGLSVLLIYYVQDFDVDLRFKETISSADLEIQKGQRGYTNQLVSIKGNLGSLSLNNEQGIFPQVYILPRLVGCIDLKEGVSVEESQIRNYMFGVVFMDEGVRSNAGQKIELPVGTGREFELVGEYNSYNVPLEAFSANNVESISLYELPRENLNPMYSNPLYYGYNIRAGKDNCNDIRINYELVKSIPLSFGSSENPSGEPQEYIGDSAILTAPFYVNSWQVNESNSNVGLEIFNQAANSIFIERVELYNIEGAISCTPFESPILVNPEEGSVIYIDCTGLNKNSIFKADITLTYNIQGSSLHLSSIGRIVSKVYS